MSSIILQKFKKKCKLSNPALPAPSREKQQRKHRGRGIWPCWFGGD
nr:MAG TPA: hypothetical protein [Caudoviricetes sp.]